MRKLTVIAFTSTFSAFAVLLLLLPTPPATGARADTLAGSVVSDDAQTGQAMPESLGDFEQGVTAPPGFAWAPTTDSMMGGSSEAQLAHTNNGADGSAGALSVNATVYLDFPYPWAGAYLAVTPEGRTGDLSAYAAIEFNIRGTPNNYRLMLFSGDLLGAPPTATFAVTSAWSKVSLPVADFEGFPAPQFTGLAITTPMEAGTFKFEIDNVRLVQ